MLRYLTNRVVTAFVMVLLATLVIFLIANTAPGDPALEPIERLLAAQPTIRVPTVVLQGEGDGVNTPEASATQARFFTGRYQRRTIPVIGHNLPQEAPATVAATVLELLKA